MIAVDKKTKNKKKRTLSSMQEVLYEREFQRADRAGGYVDNKAKH
ncbi:YfhE family protein [Cytobacillus sp.]|nr:YfhE family protein [Cytobacillus sp.]